MENKEKSKPQYYTDIVASFAAQTVRRLIACVVVLSAVCLILGFLLFREYTISQNVMLENNRKWLELWEKYDFESYHVSTDGGGDANFIGNDGDIYNGENSGEEKNQEG